MLVPEYNRNVFINCPFDEEFEPLLQAIIFTVIFLKFNPRLASEAADGAETRIAKIVSLIAESRYSIHDLSRSVAREIGEHFRLNMPFELGIDYGCRKFAGEHFSLKKFLILEEVKYRYQAALSDIAGCDIEAHGGNYERIIEKVRNWLVNDADAEAIGASRIKGQYLAFQEWYFEEKMANGASLNEIKEYPTREVMTSMLAWMDADRPD